MTKGMPPMVGDLWAKLALLFYFAYFPLSAAVCAFSASYFLRDEHVGLTKDEPVDVGCWVHLLFLMPFFIHPTFLCCLSFIILPLHLWVFDTMFYKGTTFWLSERPKQLMGEYETPPESEE